MPEGLKTLLIIALSQLPLIGGGWLWLTDRLQLRPASAAAVGVGYEVALFSANFAKKVWKDEFEKDAVKVTADWVRGFVRGFAPGFRRRYKKYVLEEHGGFNVRGLGLINTYRLSLEQVFVELRIDPTNPQLFNQNLIAQKTFTGNRPVWDFLRAGKSRESEARALAVIGPPGCGKTTMLRHVALTLAANRQRRHGVRAYTPVLLFLRDHTAAITREEPPSLGQLLQDYFGEGRLSPTLRPSAGWFDKQLARGKCMVLLDGLDEVAVVEQRKKVSAWVDAQIRNYPRCRFVLTARPQGYIDAPLERADVVLEVQPFNAAQVWKFVESWYLANEIMSSGGKLDAGVRQRANADARDLMRRLRAVPALNALTVNPLLLTMIAMVHRYRGALPGSRVGLYAEICEVLLERWRQVRDIRDSLGLKAAQKLVVLRPLAAHMMEHRLRDIGTEAALSVITQPLERVGVKPEVARNFLFELQAGSGLLVEREAELWSFAHLTFQEYLTAAQWLEQKAVSGDCCELVGDGWWHETLRLYAAQGDATPLVRACLEVNTVPALTLAADFLEENRELDPDARRATETRLIDDLESEDPTRRRLAAEVQLTRRLRNLQRIDDEREIDPDFITCAEYQLFLDDVRGQGTYRQPDHWTDLNFAKGNALERVSGVRAEDAVAFCDWLTQRQGGDARYRLPHPDEARQHEAKTSSLGAWCSEQDIFSLIGLATADEQTIRRQLANLSSLPSPSVLTIINLRNLDFDFDIDLNLNLSLDLDPDLTRALNFARALARARALNLARASALDLARALILARDLAIDRALVLARALELDLACDLVRARALVRILELARAGDIASNLDYAVALASDTIGGGTYNVVSSTYRAFILICALACAHAHLFILMLEREGVAPSDKLSNVQGVMRRFLTASEAPVKRWAILLNDMLAVARAPTLQAGLSAQRKYAARMLEYAYLGSKKGERTNRLAWSLRRLVYRKDYRGAVDEFRQSVLELYWWFQMVIAREEGKLSAWEGIRVVREQASDGDANADKPSR